MDVISFETILYLQNTNRNTQFRSIIRLDLLLSLDLSGVRLLEVEKQVQVSFTALVQLDWLH